MGSIPLNILHSNLCLGFHNNLYLGVDDTDLSSYVDDNYIYATGNCMSYFSVRVT